MSLGDRRLDASQVSSNDTRSDGTNATDTEVSANTTTQANASLNASLAVKVWRRPRDVSTCRMCGWRTLSRVLICGVRGRCLRCPQVPVMRERKRLHYVTLKVLAWICLICKAARR